MVFKNKLIPTSLVIGAYAVGIALIPKPASAATFTYYQGKANPFDNVSDSEAYENPSPKPKLFEVEGRVGVKGRTDYEFAIGPEGANHKNTGIIYHDWEDGIPINWKLTWDQTKGKAQFSLMNGRQALYSIAYPNKLGTNANLPFNAFGVAVFAKTQSGVVDPDTNIRLEVGAINGKAVRFKEEPNAAYTGPDYYPHIGLTPNAILASATSPESIFPGTSTSQQFYFRTNEVIKSMEGSVRISWVGIDPRLKGRSRIDFKINGYDLVNPGVSGGGGSATSVPEPTVVLGLMGIVALGASSLLKRKQS